MSPAALRQRKGNTVLDRVFGLPTHVLVIHAVVVLLPLAALGVVVLAAVPPWRAALRWPVLALLTAAAGATPLATQSGWRFMDSLVASQSLGGPALAQVQAHAELGGQVAWLAGLLWVLTVALVALTRPRPRGRRQGPLAAVLAVAVLLTAGATTVQVVRAGHSGSAAVWGNLGG